MNGPMTGSCLCRQVRYRVDGDAAMQVNCHCKNCQRQSGSAFSTIIGVPQDTLTIEGEFRTYTDRGESGEAVLRDFCPNCGSPLFSRVAVAPGVMFIKVGTLDDTDDFSPAMHLWTKSKQHWVDLTGQLAFARNPE